MNKTSKIFVAGHRGMVGSAIHRHLQSLGYTNIVTRTSSELDLRNQDLVQSFFEIEKPAYVFLVAAKVGGIHANNIYRADFIYDNTMIESNIIHAAHTHHTQKLLFLGSTCIYPKYCPQPIKEEYLLTGLLEYTNEPYAIAKILGIKMCEAYRDQYGSNFIAAMPTNLYGINDNFDLQTSHVLPALIRKFHEAKINQVPNVTVWGDGSAMREFLYVDDLAKACVFLMNHYNEKQFVNVGVGKDISIRDLSLLIKEITQYDGEIVFDSSKPNGTPKKVTDCSLIQSLGWQAETSLREGISHTYEWFQQSRLT